MITIFIYSSEVLDKPLPFMFSHWKVILLQGRWWRSRWTWSTSLSIRNTPFPSPGDLPDPGIEPGYPALQADALPSEPPGKPMVLLVAHGLSLIVMSGGYSLLWCMGFSLHWLLLSQSTVSRCLGFSSCGIWAQLLHGMWNLLEPGIEPRSPALVGGFLSTVLPGKSQNIF